SVFERLMPALDLALGLWVIRCAPNMLDAPAVEPFGQIAGDIGGTIVGQQPGAVYDRALIEPGGRQRQVERLSDISGPHRGAELPGDDEGEPPITFYHATLIRNALQQGG